MSEYLQGYASTLLLRHVITMATGERGATDIFKGLNVLQAMRWMASVWSKAERSTITKCFHVGGMSGDVATAVADDCDDPFEGLDEDFQDLIDQVAP